MRLHEQEPRQPEPLIKLGIKFQERQNRPKALELFQQAAALDPAGKIMMRRENGEVVSCLEMADYQYARTHVVTFGLIEYRRLEEFIKKHPTSRLVRDATLDMMVGYFTDADGASVYDPIEAAFPHDLKIANRLAGQAKSYSQYSQKDKKDPNIERSLRMSENALREAGAVSLSETAQNVAQLQILSGNPDKAEQAFGRDYRSDQVKAWAEASIGYAEFWLGRKRNMEDAEAAISLALSLGPGDPGLRRRAAALYLSPLAKPDKALGIYGPEFLKSVQSNPQDLFSYFSFWISNKTNEASAFAALEEVLKLKPESVYYRESAASVLSKAGYTDRALAVFGPEFIAGRPDDMNALYEYGAFWIQRNANLENAVPALVKSLRTIPKSYMNQYSIAQMLLRISKPDEVLAIYGPDYMAGIRDEPSALARYAQFWLKEGKGNQESALEALDLAARAKNLEAWDRLMIARSFLDAGKPSRAEDVYGAEYLKTIQSDAEALIRYSSFWKSINRNLFSALEAARRASQIAPDNGRAWGALAEASVADGNLKDALAAIEKACGLTKAEETLEKYENLRKQIKAELEKGKK